MTADQDAVHVETLPRRAWKAGLLSGAAVMELWCNVLAPPRGSTAGVMVALLVVMTILNSGYLWAWWYRTRAGST